MRRARKLRLAAKAHAHGGRHARTILEEAERAGIGIALGFALVEQESGFRNVYGHDAVANPAPKGGRVTHRNYEGIYLPARRRGLGMQGVGPVQLTYYTLQDAADRLGGCWRWRFNLRVGFENLAGQIRQHGQHGGMAAYNGAGQAAEDYAHELEVRRVRWRAILGLD